MKYFFRLLLVLLLFSSCTLFDKLFRGEEVAKLGKYALYEAEISELMPKNVSPGDSAHIASRYINSWAKKYLLLAMAESQLSKADKDVTQELEDYRLSLLGYRYEELYVKERLDTLVTEDESMTYYSDNINSFKDDISVVKARYVRIRSNSPNLKQIKSLYRSRNLRDVEKLEDLCYSSAEVYSNFNNEWISLFMIASELGSEISFCENELKKKKYIEKRDDNYTLLVFFYDNIKKGTPSPYEYNQSSIKEIIISRRKHDLIFNLENNLLDEAIKDNKLIIYRKIR